MQSRSALSPLFKELHGVPMAQQYERLFCVAPASLVDLRSI